MNPLKKFINYLTNVVYHNKSEEIISILKQCKTPQESIETFSKVESWHCQNLIEIRKNNFDLINEKKAENEAITKYIGVATPIKSSLIAVKLSDVG